MTYCGYILLRELIGGVRYEEASLTDGPVTHNYALYRLHGVTSYRLKPEKMEDSTYTSLRLLLTSTTRTGKWFTDTAHPIPF